MHANVHLCVARVALTLLQQTCCFSKRCESRSVFSVCSLTDSSMAAISQDHYYPHSFRVKKKSFEKCVVWLQQKKLYSSSGAKNASSAAHCHRHLLFEILQQSEEFTLHVPHSLCKIFTAVKGHHFLFSQSRRHGSMKSQHTILIVFLRVLLIAIGHCRWLTQSLERPLLSQVLRVWRARKASSIKYFTEEVPSRAKATQPDHIETLSVCLNFLRTVLLNVRIYVTVITASGAEVIWWICRLSQSWNQHNN